MSATKDDWIQVLDLQPHPEGGWYREIYRANEAVRQDALPTRFASDRAFSTAIYYLLGQSDFSALHRIHQDEIWHFYDGAPLAVEVIHPNGSTETLQLGRNLHAGERPFAVVPAGCWFGARPKPGPEYSLVGCTVAPGFDFDDFELANRANLIEVFPQHRQLIEQLTR